MVESMIQMAQEPVKIIPGYADFCKIIAIKNSQNDIYHFDLKHLTVNKSNAISKGAQLHTAYEARNEKELAVLVEWVTGLEAPTADYIHLIIYSREQLAKENDIIEADWGIVAIATANQVDVEPMRPITMMRNALGIEEGGSGVPLDPKAYKESCDYWSKHIMIRY